MNRADESPGLTTRADARLRSRQQHGENAGQEYSIESSGAADRRHGGAESFFALLGRFSLRPLLSTGQA